MHTCYSKKVYTSFIVHKKLYKLLWFCDLKLVLKVNWQRLNKTVDTNNFIYKVSF